MDTQAVYEAAVRKRNEQAAMDRAFKIKEQAVKNALRSLFVCLQAQQTQMEILLKRMMLAPLV